MTDKATVEIGSPVAGRIVALHGNSGGMARVGAELVVIETAATASQADGPAPSAAPRSDAPATVIAPAAVPAATARTAATAPSPSTSPPAKSLAAPAVRARAAQLGVDLARIRGSGDGGRVEHADLDAFLLQGSPSVGRQQPAAVTDTIEEIPVIGIRRQIANAMQESKRRIPHFTYVEEIDVTALEDLRADLNRRHGDRPRLTLLPLLIRGMVHAIATHGGVNAHYDEAAAVIRRHKAVHMGVATQTPRGLVVPVVRDAEGFDLWGLAAEIERLTQAARAGKATREELSGSTITVSSLGRLGGIMATPIIKPPEVAIVGVNKIAERPVVLDGRLIIRKIMNLSSSFDHRVVDGFDAADFIQTLRGYLETPAELFME